MKRANRNNHFFVHLKWLSFFAGALAPFRSVNLVSWAVTLNPRSPSAQDPLDLPRLRFLPKADRLEAQGHL